MSDYIPADLWRRILLHLPIKTLCICLCVCTTLNFIITSSEFIASHLSIASAIDAPERRILVVSNYDDGDYSLYPSDNLSCTAPCPGLRFPFETLTDSRDMFCLIGVLRGVICLSLCNTRTHSADLILWNPSICKYFTLPTPFTCCSDSRLCHGTSNFGFGFDAIAKDFKIVRSPCTCKSCWENLNPQMTPVFSVRDGVWRYAKNNEITDNAFRYMEKRATFFNGAIHWFRFNRGMGTESLLVYDCHLEQFGAMGLPQVYAEPTANEADQILLKGGEINLEVFNGMLAVFGYNWYPWFNYHTCDVWVMKEYGVVDSWTNLFVIQLDGGEGRILMDRKKEDGDELIISHFDELISFNTKTSEKKDLGIEFEHRSNIYVGTFEPSLLLLDVMGSQSYQKDESIEI